MKASKAAPTPTAPVTRTVGIEKTADGWSVIYLETQNGKVTARSVEEGPFQYRHLAADALMGVLALRLVFEPGSLT